MTSIPESIIKVTLVNNLTGEEFELEEKEGSYCLFLKQQDAISYVADYIRFRLDWNDLNKDGDPSLDADIVDDQGKQYQEKISAHHTTRRINSGSNNYTYHFQQGTIDILFTTRLAMQVNQHATAHIIQNP